MIFEEQRLKPRVIRPTERGWRWRRQRRRGDGHDFGGGHHGEPAGDARGGGGQAAEAAGQGLGRRQGGSRDQQVRKRSAV